MRTLVLLPILALAACAPMADRDQGAVTASTAGQCFESGQIINFNVKGSREAYVQSQRNYVFGLTTSADCFSPGVGGLTLAPHNSSGPRMCPGQQVRVRILEGSPVSQTCIATLSGPITDSSVSGLTGRR